VAPPEVAPPDVASPVGQASAAPALVRFEDVRAQADAMPAGGVGGALKALGAPHHHAYKERLGAFKKDGMTPAQKAAVRAMLGGRKGMIDHAQLKGGSDAWTGIRDSVGGVPAGGPGVQRTPAQEATKTRHEGLMQARYAKLAMPALLRARDRVNSGQRVPQRQPGGPGFTRADMERGFRDRESDKDVWTHQADQIKSDLPMVGTGSANLSSDVDVNSRGPFSSFALGNVNRAASAALARGGMPASQTAGTSVDVNFYA